MKVDKWGIFLDDEDEAIYRYMQLEEWDDKYALPRWAYLDKEWLTYVSKRRVLYSKLRKLSEKLCYTVDVTRE